MITRAHDLATAQRAADELAIVRTISRLARAQDDRDRDAYRGCFTDVVRLDEAVVVDTWPADLPVDDLAERYFAVVSGNDFSQHLVANHVVEVDGDEATCDADLFATSVRSAAGERTTTYLHGRYRLGLRRVDGAWRIHRRSIRVRHRDQHVVPLAEGDGDLAVGRTEPA